MLVLDHDVSRHDEGTLGRGDLSAIVSDADDRALAPREGTTKVGHQLGFGQVS